MRPPLPVFPPADNRAGGTVSVLLNQATGDCRKSAPLPIGSGCHRVFQADLDRDRDLDLAPVNLAHVDDATIMPGEVAVYLSDLVPWMEPTVRCGEQNMRSTARIVSIFLVACLALGQLACTVTVTDANARTGTRGTTTGQQNQDGTAGTGGDPCDFMTAAERQQIADAVALQRDNGVTQQEMLDGFPETACAQAAQQGSAVSTADCVDCMESIVNDVYAGP